jgi:hypothetical protein
MRTLSVAEMSKCGYSIDYWALEYFDYAQYPRMSVFFFVKRLDTWEIVYFISATYFIDKPLGLQEFFFRGASWQTKKKIHSLKNGC